MNKYKDVITNVSKFFDMVAGISMLVVMSLVVFNILMRTLFNKPFLGTYEYVGFITSLMIGLSLAYCAANNGHVAISFIMEKLPRKTQALIDMTITMVTVVFLSIFSWQIANYAHSMVISGEVSPTTMTPVYPFIYAVAFGVFMLCLVMIFKFIESLGKVIGK